MIPPTPGPVAAAGILGADLGQVILWGMLVSLPTLAVSWLYASRIAARSWIEPLPGPHNPERREREEPEHGERERAPRPPGAGHALSPILLPIFLILLKSVADLPSHPLGSGAAAELARFAGDPAIALLLGAALALTLPEKLDRGMLSTTGWVGEGLTKGAVIILITGSGGAFGKVLQESGIGDILGEGLGGLDLGIWLPFVLAAAIKTAQGSSTVAIITTASIVAPLAGPLGLTGGLAPTFTVLAIGAGSMVVSHANDSYFWVVSQFSDMSVKLGYRLHTVGTLVEGLTAAVVIWGLSLLLVG